MKYVFILTILCIVAILLLARCKEKQENEKEVNIKTWLEEKYNGRVVVAERVFDLNPARLFDGKRVAVIAAGDDPDVQIKVNWNKQETDLGIDRAQLETEIEDARRDMKLAREISAQLKSAGVENISVGVMKPAFYFLPFGDPVPAARQKYLDAVLEFLEKRNDTSYASIFIEFLEDSVQGKEFKDVIPNGYWYRGDSYHASHKIMSLDFEWSPDIDKKALSEGWEINTLSDRSGKYRELAFAEATKWAEKNLKQPYYLEPVQMVMYEGDQEEPLAIHFSFPLYDQKPAENEPAPEDREYVTGLFQVDKGTFTQIKKIKDQ